MTGIRCRALVLLVVAGVALPAMWLPARVFFQSGSTGGDVFVPGSFGAEIYKAVMLINGGRAEVGVAVCAEGVAAVRAAFAALGSRGSYAEGESLGFGSATVGDRSVRLVTLATAPGAPLLMVAVQQPETGVRAVQQAPARHRLEEVPVPPDAAVLSYQKNTDTRTALERVSSRLPREALARYYEGTMAGVGWCRMFRSAARPGLSAYVRGGDLCWVRIGDTDSNGETRVTLLHKPGAVK